MSASNIHTIQDYPSADPKNEKNPTGYSMTKKPVGSIHTIHDFKDTYSAAYKMPPANKKTMDKLKKNETVPQGDVTRLINYLIKHGDKATFKDISDEIFLKEKSKHPNMSDDKIIKEIVKRFKGVDSKNFIRAEYQEVIIPSGGGKIKTKPPAGNAPKELKGREAFDDMIQQKTPLVDSAKTAYINETKMMPTMTKGSTTKGSTTKGSTTDFPSVEKPSAKKATTVSDIFDMSSNLYKKNKPLMDSITGAFSEENIANGSWLAEIASLSQPEIKIVNELMKWTPLGATTKDYQAIENRKQGKPSGLTSNEEIMLVVKSLVNPSIIGKNIESAVEETTKSVSDAVGNTWNKLTGHKMPDQKTVLEQQSAEAVARRLEAKRKATEKAKYIDALITPDFDPKKKPDTVINLKPAEGGADPIRSGAHTSGSGSGTTFGRDGKITNTTQTGDGQIVGVESTNSRTPEEKQAIFDANYFTPPKAEDYGWSDPTVLQDMGRWFRKALWGQSPFLYPEPSNKAEYLAQLERQNPELYARYDKQMKAYNWKLHRSTLEMDSMVDPSYDENKKIIQSIEDVNNALIKRARSLGQLTKEQAEESYNIHESLQKIMKGESMMTFEDVRNINSRLVEQFSPEVRKLAEPQIKIIYDTVTALTKDLHTGGSPIDVIGTLTDSPPAPAPVDPVNDTVGVIKPKPRPVLTEEEEKKRREDEDEEEPDDPVETETGKNTLVSEKRIEVGMDDSFPRLRPQLEWGGTDKLLDRDSGEYKRAENYAELMSINPIGWYNGAGNKLYLANEKTDQMRYGRTYQLNYKPKPYDPNPAYYRQKLKANVSYSKPLQSTNETFNELQRPIFTSQYAPMVGFEQARDQYDFQQFSRPTAKEFQTVYPVVQRQQYHNYFPDTINEETGGIPQMAMMSPNEFIIQSRYRR